MNSDRHRIYKRRISPSSNFFSHAVHKSKSKTNIFRVARVVHEIHQGEENFHHKLFTEEIHQILSQWIKPSIHSLTLRILWYAAKKCFLSEYQILSNISIKLLTPKIITPFYQTYESDSLFLRTDCFRVWDYA